jgi:hypothetical protein
LLLCISCSTLISCGPIQAKQVEGMSGGDREALLNTKNNDQLCKAYNNTFIKPETEKQVESILQRRGVTECKAHSMVRYITQLTPPDEQKTVIFHQPSYFLNKAYSATHMCELIGIYAESVEESKQLGISKSTIIEDFMDSTSSLQETSKFVNYKEIILASIETIYSSTDLSSSKRIVRSNCLVNAVNSSDVKVAQDEESINDSSIDGIDTMIEVPLVKADVAIIEEPLVKDEVLETPVAVDQNFSFDNDVLKDIQEIQNSSIEKGELETTAEFNLRKGSLRNKFVNHSYTYKTSVANLTTKYYKPLKYNADTETLTLYLPRLELKLFMNSSNGNYSTTFLTYSFLEVDIGKMDSSNYTARNGLGREVNVEKLVVESNGFAILSKNNPDMNPQYYTVQINRDRVRDILDNGKIEFKLRMDLIDEKFQKSPLVTESEHQEPTMKRPIEFDRTDKMLPVRLISISVYDGKGNKVMEKPGSQVNVPAFHKM